ncbi:hypothetical protein BDZ89DRAFT_1134308 [Hymenopellis radicata]|nr:hypothetical protein BDZ89DRAFT_1134308 [Hymenopellis radicata]
MADAVNRTVDFYNLTLTAVILPFTMCQNHCIGDTVRSVIIAAAIVTVMFVIIGAIPLISWCCRNGRLQARSGWQSTKRGVVLLSAGIDMVVDSVYARLLPPPHISKLIPLHQYWVLPLELLDSVFGCCDEDQHALLTCGLVCYRWNVLSRQRLRMTIGPRKHSLGLARLLRSPHETFSRNVHQIILCGDSPGDLSQHRRILRLLALKGFTLRRVILTRDAQFTHFLPRYHPNITDVSFRDEPRPNYDHLDLRLRTFLAGISLYQKLQSLSIQTCVPSIVGLPAPQDSLPIKRLEVHGCWSDDLMSWLQESCRTLQVMILKFHVDRGMPVDTAKMTLFLRANWETLRHVTLTLYGSFENSAIRLDMLEHLVSIHLVLTADYESCYSLGVPPDAASPGNAAPPSLAMRF